MFHTLTKDIKRYLGNDRVNIKEIIYLLTAQDVWAIVVYRFGYWVHHYCKIPIINTALKIFAFVAFKFIEIAAGISIPFSVQIGEGLRLGHFGGPIINSKVRIGKNCSMGIGNVIGTKGLGDKGVPEIGDNVYIGAGAKILGGIKIGNNVNIGANAVVIDDIPDNATAVGIPAKVVMIKESKC